MNDANSRNKIVDDVLMMLLCFERESPYSTLTCCRMRIRALTTFSTWIKLIINAGLVDRQRS